MSVGGTTIHIKGNQIICSFCLLLSQMCVQVSLVFELKYGESSNQKLELFIYIIYLQLYKLERTYLMTSYRRCSEGTRVKCGHIVTKQTTRWW